MKDLRIAFACDHAGYELKEKLVKYLDGKVASIKDFGCHSTQSVDYPDFIHPLAEAIENNEYDFGIILCGSGIGVSITANKHQGIRAAVCWCNDIAALCRQHNNANVLALPARFIDEKQAKQFVDTFLTTAFEGGRHINRVNKIPVQK